MMYGAEPVIFNGFGLSLVKSCESCMHGELEMHQWASTRYTLGKIPQGREDLPTRIPVDRSSVEPMSQSILFLCPDSFGKAPSE